MYGDLSLIGEHVAVSMKNVDCSSNINPPSHTSLPEAAPCQHLWTTLLYFFTQLMMYITLLPVTVLYYHGLEAQLYQLRFCKHAPSPVELEGRVASCPSCFHSWQHEINIHTKWLPSVWLVTPLLLSKRLHCLYWMKKHVAFYCSQVV